MQENGQWVRSIGVYSSFVVRFCQKSAIIFAVDTAMTTMHFVEISLLSSIGRIVNMPWFQHGCKTQDGTFSSCCSLTDVQCPFFLTSEGQAGFLYSLK